MRILAILLLTMTLAQGQEPMFYSYDEARDKSIITGKPLIVMVTAKWCKPCQTLKNEINQLDKKVIDSVIWCSVDYDKQRDLSKKLLVGELIPQLAGFREVHEKGLNLVGASPKQKIVEFLQKVKTHIR